MWRARTAPHRAPAGASSVAQREELAHELTDEGPLAPRLLLGDAPAQTLEGLGLDAERRREAAHGLELLGVLVVSCPWLEDDHPDPLGEQLRSVAKVLRAFANQAAAYHPSCRCGVLWDFCSTPQV